MKTNKTIKDTGYLENTLGREYKRRLEKGSFAKAYSVLCDAEFLAGLAVDYDFNPPRGCNE